MISTSTPFGPDFVKELLLWVIQQFGIATAKAFRMIWDIGMAFLFQHWVAVLFLLFVVFVYAVVRALAGHWWVLGSVLYNYFYFGTLFVIGLICGPEVFANDYFRIIALLVYLSCYTIVGKIVTKIK